MTTKLTSQQQTTLLNIAAYVDAKLAHDFSGHDMAHIKRVVRLCEFILESEPTANTYLVLLAAYLHDVIDDKVVDDTEQARRDLVQKLTQEKIAKCDQQMILEIIDNMSYRQNLTEQKRLSLEGKIVQDADRLDAIGAIGIGRTFYYGGNKHNIMHDPNISYRESLDESSYRNTNTVINHFYEKLLLLKDKMNTDAAKKLAAQRHQFLLEFVRQFENEWLCNID